MTYVALASLGLVLLSGSAAFAIVRWLLRGQARERQEWAAERRELNDRLAHASGNTWTPPPLRIVPEQTEPRERELVFADIDEEPDL